MFLTCIYLKLSTISLKLNLWLERTCMFIREVKYRHFVAKQPRNIRHVKKENQFTAPKLIFIVQGPIKQSVIFLDDEQKDVKMLP